MPMTKPKHFILNTDYATTQNDAKGTVSYSVPAGTVIPNGSTAVFEATLNIGTRNAYMRGAATISSQPGKWFSGNTVIAEANVDLAGYGPGPWPLYHTLERISPSTIRVYCELYNNTGVTATVATTQTVTWDINTFLSPFPN